LEKRNALKKGLLGTKLPVAQGRRATTHKRREKKRPDSSIAAGQSTSERPTPIAHSLLCGRTPTAQDQHQIFVICVTRIFGF